MNHSEKFPARERIKKRKDFQRIFEKGTRKEGQYFTLIRIEATDKKIGLVLNRHIKPAVTRNKLKRRLRAIYRGNKSFFKGETLVIAHPNAQTLSYLELKKELLNLCKQ